jgi:hypothetical protein
MLHRLEPLLTRLWLVTLVLMGLFALAFGLVSLNIISLLNTNFALIARHDATALADGALPRLFELGLHGYAAVVCYVLFKACERVLVEEILG